MSTASEKLKKIERELYLMSMTIAMKEVVDKIREALRVIAGELEEGKCAD